VFTCDISIAHQFIRFISTTCNDSFISVTIISPGKSLLSTPYRASSRAGKKRLLTAPTVAEPKAFAPQKSQTSPHPGVAESLYLQPQHRLAGRPPFPISRQTSHDQPHYPAPPNTYFLPGPRAGLGLWFSRRLEDDGFSSTTIVYFLLKPVLP
jgi:hypothetical protein